MMNESAVVPHNTPIRQCVAVELLPRLKCVKGLYTTKVGILSSINIKTYSNFNN